MGRERGKGASERASERGMGGGKYPNLALHSPFFSPSPLRGEGGQGPETRAGEKGWFGQSTTFLFRCSRFNLQKIKPKRYLKFPNLIILLLFIKKQRG